MQTQARFAGIYGALFGAGALLGMFQLLILLIALVVPGIIVVATSAWACARIGRKVDWTQPDRNIALHMARQALVLGAVTGAIAGSAAFIVGGLSGIYFGVVLGAPTGALAGLIAGLGLFAAEKLRRSRSPLGRVLSRSLGFIVGVPAGFVLWRFLLLLFSILSGGRVPS